MKKIIFTLIISCFYINGFAQSDFSGEKTIVLEDVEEIEETDSEEKSRKIRLWIPGFTFNVASWFVDKESNNEEKQLLKSIGNVSLFVLTNTDVSDKRFIRYQNRLNKKVKRKRGEELVVVETKEAIVNIKALYNRKGNMKKAIVFVDADDTLLFAKVGGLLDVNSLMKFIND